MGRRRTRDKHLPARVYLEHGAYYFRDGKNKRVLLGREISAALAKYGALIGSTWNGRTMGDVIDRYRVQVLPLKRAEKTRDDQARQLERLKGRFGHMLPDNITAQHCYEWMDRRRSKDGKPVPVAARHEIVLLGHVLGKAIRWGVASVNAVRSLERFKRGPKRRQVTVGEVEAIRALATERMRLAIDLAVSVGQRRGDLLTLRFDQGREDGIYFQPSKTIDTSQAEILMEWSEDLRALWTRSKAISPQIPREYLIRTRTGQPYTPDGFNGNWQRLMRKYVAAGGARFHFHDLRSVSANKASTVEEAQARLGHASVETTKRFYYHGVTKAKPSS